MLCLCFLVQCVVTSYRRVKRRQSGTEAERLISFILVTVLAFCNKTKTILKKNRQSSIGICSFQ